MDEKTPRGHLARVVVCDLAEEPLMSDQIRELFNLLGQQSVQRELEMIYREIVSAWMGYEQEEAEGNSVGGAANAALDQYRDEVEKVFVRKVATKLSAPPVIRPNDLVDRFESLIELQGAGKDFDAMYERVRGVAQICRPGLSFHRAI